MLHSIRSSNFSELY